MYIESEKVKFYPSAYRQYQDGTETKNINPESELNTEYNITSHIAKLLKKNKGCFVVDYIENVKLEFYLGGYYIHITSPQDILGAFSSATEIWANMKVAPFTPTDTTKGFSELYEVVDYEDSGKNIDEWSEGTVLFKGVAFSKTKDNSATFSLQLFARQDITKPWSILESSKYILDTREIFNFNGDYSIDEDFYTLYASIDDLYSETSSIDEATINTALTVDGTAKFNSQVDLNANLVPTTNNNRNIGSSGKEFANIYVNKIIGVSEIDNGQNNIVLKSTIEPSGTIDLGLSTAPITNIYATNIYGTNLKDVSEIDGGQNSITLKSDIIPNSNGTLDLGNSSNRFKSSYVGTSYVSTLNSTDNEIKVAKDIVPASYTTLNLGSSTNQLFGVYAQNFYGNASTATKLNGTDAGGTKNPVYFSNGVPTASLYNSDLYDRIERESTFQNVLSAATSNTKSFTINIPVAQTSTIHLNMFTIIFRPSSYAEFNGGMCTMNFRVHTTTSTSTIYSNHIYAYKSILYRLKVTRSNLTVGLVRFTCVLQYINKSSATDEDGGWADVDGEYVQDATVYYTYR